MKTNYNNLILNELNEVVERENLCKDELLNVGNKIKQEVFGAISDSANLLSSYRYTIHLRNELSYKRKRLKKNEKLSSGKNELEIFFDDILSFLNAEIDYILLSLKHFSIRNDNGERDKSKTQKGINKIRWTANNIDLVELIYALYHSKSLNDGNINIKVIVKTFEVFFDVKLGNHYRTYVDITRRKINRSKFLCNLLRVIEDKFIETDRK